MSRKSSFVRANVGLKPFHLLRKQHALGKSARVRFRNPAREWEMAGLLLAIPKYVSYCSCRNAGVSSSLCSFIFGGVLLFCFVVVCGFLGFLFLWLVCFGIFLTLFPQTSLCWSSHFLQKWPNGSLQLCPFLELFSAGVPCSSEQTSRILVHPPSVSMWTGQNFPEPSANTFSSNFWALLSPPPCSYLQPLRHMWILLSPCKNCWCQPLTIICCLQECNKPFNCSSLNSLSFCGLQRGKKAAWGKMFYHPSVYQEAPGTVSVFQCIAFFSLKVE